MRFLMLFFAVTGITSGITAIATVRATAYDVTISCSSPHVAVENSKTRLTRSRACFYVDVIGQSYDNYQ